MTRLKNFRTWVLSAALFGAVLTSAPSMAAPGDNIILLADSVYLQGGNVLTASGNVEAISGETTLTAEKIVYDSIKDKITITGPIKISDGQSVEFFAEFAELDTELQNGLLRSARLVLSQQIELRAEEIRRIRGNTSELSQVRVTSCQTCEEDTPLWHIRASKVTHDEDKKRLFLDEAQVRVLDIPIFYMPRLSLPDPTQTRASGFLIPSFKQSSRIGTGVKIPYFFAIGDHKDLTLTPYISRNMTTLEARYRQAFVLGDIEIEGALTRDNFSGQGTRGYVFAHGNFDLKRDYKLAFDTKLTSDAAYLSDYNYTNLDRLKSELEITRASRDENTRFGIYNYRSLRSNEDNRTLPGLIISAETEKRFNPAYLGGQASWKTEFHSHARASNTDIIGRDVARINGALNWTRDWWTQSGLNFELEGNLAYDMVATTQDSSITDQAYAQFTPSLGATMRYPLVRQWGSGTDYLEPIVQVAWSGGATRDGTPNAIANDESTHNEFDEGNLVALSRFTSEDRRERGFSLAVGANWAHFGESYDAKLSFGQVFRQTDQISFSNTSGLSGTTSGLLVAGQISHQNGLSFTGRTVLSPNLSLSKAEASLGWTNDRLNLGAAYVWLRQDAKENRPATLAEWNLDTSYRMTRHWTGLANIRYDVQANETTQAGFGIEYQNECVKAQLGVSRRFTSSTSVKPVTDITFTVELLGFSAKTRDKSYSRKCKSTAF